MLTLTVKMKGILTHSRIHDILSLLALVVLENSTVLLTKFTRLANSNELYDIVDMMIVTEFCKVFLSLCLESYCARGEFLNSIRQHLNFYSFDSLKVAMPALLYFVQNSLFYVALTNLSSPVFQVLYQMKLLTTAFVSVLIMRRCYSVSQWISLCFLTLGAIIAVDANQTTASEAQVVYNSKYYIGISAVIIACFCSAFAGVLFEKLLKQENKNELPDICKKPSIIRAPSLWMRNVQLASFSLIFAILQYLWSANFNLENERHPFLFGFTFWTWILVVLRASCGILVAVIIKNTDNVIKSITSSVSVLIGCILSLFLFGTKLQGLFWIGMVLVISSSYFFSRIKTSVFEYPRLSKNISNGLIVLFSLSLLIGCSFFLSHTAPIDAHHKATDNYDNLHFVVFVKTDYNPKIDCGGCLVLWELYFNLKSQNLSVSTSTIPDKSIIGNRTIVGVYPEVDHGSMPGVDIHVRWILAPVGIHVAHSVVKTWKSTDLVFNYATSTGERVPLSNILQVVNTPYKGDESDISDEQFYSKSRSGIAWMMRKGNKFHPNIIPMHQKPGYNVTDIGGSATIAGLRQYEYFFTYDPYTYWTWFAAMQGTVSIIYPLANVTKKDWAFGTFLGTYMQAQNIEEVPGVAYGWEENEIDFARKTMHLVRPFLLKLRQWGAEVTVPRFVRDCYRFSQGERDGFEGALLLKDVYQLD